MKFINKFILLLFVSLFSKQSHCIFNFSAIRDIGVSALKNKLYKTTQLALNYTVFNKTYSFKDENDFSADGESFLSYTISPGNSLKLYCGTKETRKSGLISLYPPDPLNSTLAPMSKGGINESLGRVIKNFDLFRSDNTLVHYTSELFGGSYLFQHPYSAVIVSKNVDFTLNVACVYNPNALNRPLDPESGAPDPNLDKNTENLLYRWIQIKYTGVMPISYGCGSGNQPLFSNLSPVKNFQRPEGPPLQTSHACEVSPEPGMVVGIYCATDEVFDEELCFRDSAHRTFYDPEFAFTNAPGRLHLFRVPDAGYDSDVSFQCRCKDRRGEPTAELRVFKPSVFVCDFTKVLENLTPGQKLTLQSCRHELHPGESLRLIAPLNFTVFFYLRKKYLSVMEPNDMRDHTYVQSLGSNKVTIANVSDVIISKGFEIEKVDVRGRIEHVFKYAKDAVVILKTENASLSYYWTMMKTRAKERQQIDFITPNERVMGIVNIGLVPTDPYTIGCGVRNEFFRHEFVDFQSTSENNRVVSRCTVDASKGAVGFYCPSPFLLEPRGCFKSVLAVRKRDDGALSEEVRELGGLLKNARAHRSANLAILELYKSAAHQAHFSAEPASEAQHDADFDALVCRCVDSEGNLVASISVVNPSVSSAEPPQEPLEDQPLPPSEPEIGEITTRIE